MNAKSRPIHLNLMKMKFPPMAIVSIMHRISGVLLFLLLPLALYLLHASLKSQVSFAELHAFVAMPIVKFLLWMLVSAVSFHLFAGIRHMLMDCGLGEQVKSARMTAYLIIALEVVAVVLAGVWLWG
ncbi:MAG: succinate dehydrogenase, cytochrome b556 subunit [Coxiellaceae bacterium]|nr:succinate dehydrogenase, cytochrome b556 subunit [Coxiellaceae bacterium]